MMPGLIPVNARRGQNDYQQYQYQNPYYGHPQNYHPGHQHYGPQYQQQWYPQYPQQYPQPPRPYHPPLPPPQQQNGPLIVSSHAPPHTFHPAALARPHQMPTPPAQQIQTPPQQMPLTPLAAPYTRASPAVSIRSTTIATPPPSSSTSGPSTAAAETMAAQVPAQVEPPFCPPLPWLSVPEEPFPARARRRRRKARQPQSTTVLELPSRDREESVPEAEDAVEAGETTEELSESQTSTVAAPSEQETPATSQAPSEIGSEHHTTPTSTIRQTPIHTRTGTKPAIPIVLATPKVAVPAARKPSATPSDSAKASSEAKPMETDSSPESAPSSTTLMPTPPSSSSPETTLSSVEPAPIAKTAPKSWAELVRTNASKTEAAATGVNGTLKSDDFNSAKAVSTAEAIRAFTVDSGGKISFLKPRGLVNSGNMCYMNSVLQILVFCSPFYDFLDLVSKRAAHKFKSDTPLLDALILFLREFPIIDSADSVEQLRLRLKKEELEQFGEPFKPEYVYKATSTLPRFATMRRGHQQDAEEYLNFLLEALHDECAKILGTNTTAEANNSPSPTSERSVSGGDAGWQEVGPKQRAAVTQSSGNSSNESPITKIFGGTFRSELRVPGKKNSVTFQPYQPLQLDIGAPEVQNIVDALKGLTRSETLHGDFKSPRGPDVAATKQIFIESLPPVLILHLKRFEYNNHGGTQKIWKRVGYPLELQIPKEVFPQQKRAGLALSGLPKYKLTGVIYHHGKNASSGHYTVDVRRQEGREWIRMDDTVIRRLRTEDVAAGGAEEDPKILAKALEQHKDALSGKTNIFDQFGELEEDESAESGGAWNQAGTKETANGAGSKKWSAVANGTATPSSTKGTGSATPTQRDIGKAENKVAYILFYRRI